MLGYFCVPTCLTKLLHMVVQPWTTPMETAEQHQAINALHPTTRSHNHPNTQLFQCQTSTDHTSSCHKVVPPYQAPHQTTVVVQHGTIPCAY